MKTGKEKKVAVIGLGQMGTRIAQLYGEAGFEVKVWNRTPNKGASLTNATIIESLEEVIANNTLIMVCVYDNPAVKEILDRLSDPGILKGKTVVNFSTGRPDEAEHLEKLLRRHGGHYLNGAIQVAPDQMGLPETIILMGGDSSVMKKHAEELNILGGNIRHLGDAAATSPAMDLASLTWLYGSYVGLIYGVKLCQAFGLSLRDFGDIIEEITPGFAAFFKHDVKMIAEDHYDVTQSPLSISVGATRRIADTFKELPVDQEFVQIISGILQRADAEYGGKEQEVAVIAKTIESRSKTLQRPNSRETLSVGNETEKQR